MVHPVFHVSRLEEFPNQPYKVLIFDSAAEDVHQHMVVDVVKAAFNISFHKPRDPSESLFDLHKRRMAAPIRSESVGVRRESVLIDTFQYHADYLLHQFILEGWDAQRTFFLWIVVLGNIGSSGRTWLITAILQGCNQRVDSFGAHSINGQSVSSCCHIALFCVDILIGKQKELRIVKIAVQPFIDVFAVTCFGS